MPPERVDHPLARPLRDQLDRFAAQHRLGLAAVLAGGWAVVVGRHTGADQVAAGRSAPVRLDWEQPVADWLASLPEPDGLEPGREPADGVPPGQGSPLESIVVSHHPDRPAVEARFDPGLVPADLVRRLLAQLEAALESLATATILDDVDPLPAGERAELAARAVPRASFPPGPAGLLPARFVDRATRDPERVAVCHGEHRVSYRQLLAGVSRLTYRLRGLGVGPGSLVGIYLPRGVDLVTAVLATACAGGAYLPVDRRDPVARLRGLMADASVTALITDRAGAGALADPAAAGAPAGGKTDPAAAGAPAGGEADPAAASAETGPVPPTVVLDDPAETARLAGQPERPPALSASAEDPAYVIYTSGSTGTPKGVVVEHAQLTRLFDATAQWFGFGPDDVWTLFHSIAFDFSVWELWGALSHGGRLVVVPEQTARDPGGFRQLLLDQQVTVLNQTPASFRNLIEADLAAGAAPSPYALRHVIFGGDRLELAGLRPWLDRYGDRRPRLANMYGITETTVHVTYRPITVADLAAGTSSPIGTPIADLAVRLVDARGRLVPIGVPGEIEVTGAGVARGYLNRPELTAQRFVELPGPTGTQRWYRTGDQARWLPDGDLEYLGRLDNQVKVRGYRIELGEIESVLSTHPQVRQVAVVARQSAVAGHRQLVAYLVPAAGAELAWPQVRQWLARRLPDQLVPAAGTCLPALPLTPNGKVDRAALPEPLPSAGPATAGGCPADAGGAGAPGPVTGDPVERVLAEVAAEVLGLARVNVTDNFFALGGDSILAIQVAARARTRGVSVTPAQLFTHQSIADLATVAVPTTEPGTGAEPGEVTGEVPVTSAFQLAQVDQSQLDALAATHGPLADLYPLAPLQRGLLFHTLANPASGVYFEQFSIGLEGQLDAAVLTRVWQELHQRHEVLRAAIAWQGLAVPHLVVRQRVELPLRHHDWREQAPAAQAVRLDELLAADRTAGFDLASAPLTRLHLIRLAEARWNLVWSHHHILLDRWSVAKIIQEVFDTYQAIRAGTYEPVAPPRPFRDYLAYLAGRDLSDAPAYWRRVLDGISEPTPLADRPPVRAGRRDADYARIGTRLSAAQSEAVREFARTHQVTLDTILHGAWALLLAHHSGRDDVLFAVTSSGRPPDLAGVEEMIGLFINTLPARVRVDRATPVADWLAGLLRDQARAREFEHTPLELIRSWSAIPPDQPLFETGRALVNFPWDGSHTGDVTITEIRTFEQASHAATFLVVPESSLNLQLWYDALRFDPATAEYLLQTVTKLVLGLTVDPHRPVGALLAGLLAAPAQPAIPAGARLPELVGHWAARQPQRPAVIAGEQRLTYRELAQRAARLARLLAEHGAGPGSPVALALPISPEQVVALLGVLKAGAVAIPLPAGAVAGELESRLRPALRVEPAGDGEIRVVGLPPAPAPQRDGRAGNRPAEPGADGPAVIAWWREADGALASVALTDDELVRRASEQPAEIGPADVVGQCAEAGTEQAAGEIWTALAAGAALALCPAAPAGRWWDAITAQPVTVLTLTATALTEVFDQQPSALAGLRLLRVAGDLPAPYARRLRASLPALTITGAADRELGRLGQRLRELPGVREAVLRPSPDQRGVTAYVAVETRVLAGGGELVERLGAAHLARWRARPESLPPAASGEQFRWLLGPDARVLVIGAGSELLDGLLDGRGRGAAEAGFDLVVLDRVVAHLPGPAHLARVIDGALSLSNPTGAVLLGDVPQLALRPAAELAKLLHRAADLLPVEELAARLSRSPAEPEQLLVDPPYLTGLTATDQRIGAAAALVRPGHTAAQAARFGYDAVLWRVAPPPPAAPRWYDWERDLLSPTEIEWLLEQAGGDAVGISGAPHAGVAMDLAAVRLLERAADLGTTGRLRLAAGQAASGVDPAELYEVAKQLGWSVTVSWAAEPGRLDLLFRRGTSHPASPVHPPPPEPLAAEPLAAEPLAGELGPAAGALTSQPLRAALVEDLARRARAVLAEALPGSAGAFSVVTCSELPRTPTGKLDETALAAARPSPSPAPATATPATTAPVPPRTADELRLARIWSRVLGVTTVDVRASFFDLGGDSMLAIRLIDEATRALGRPLPLALLLRQPTIEQMAAALADEPADWTPLVELNAGTGTPFFCAHPAGGTVLCYGELGRLVGPRPFYALQARGVDNDDPPDDDLPTMAARYLTALRDRQPAGPYLLGGWSLGGLVAYEMAQQLHAGGEQVGLLVLIDTPTPGVAGDPPDPAAAMARLLADVMPIDLAQLRAMPPARRLRYVLGEAERVGLVPPGMDPRRAERMFEAYSAHLAALRRYRPSPYPGSVRLLRAIHSGIEGTDYGWAELLTGQWQVIDVPGNHESMVWPPHVQRLAQVLRDQLTDATGA